MSLAIRRARPDEAGPDWNTPSIEFCKSLGAVLMDEWTICRVAGPAPMALAEGMR